jgi:CBS domain containing-hemolysin-like protein
MTSLLLVFGEIGPKRIAVLYPERISTYYAPVMERLIRWLMPARWLMDILTSGFQHLFHPTGRTLTEEEFEGVVEISGDEGILDKDEHQMVESILRLEDLQASDVMTPRLDMVGIDLNDPPTDLLKRIRQIKVRRVVLFRDQVDEVEGFLDTRQYLLDPQHDLMKAWLPPFYVPEAAPLDKLLAQFQRETKRAAIVVDEYGGTAGIVTRGDILEEITGEIGPEQEGHRLTVEPIGPNRWLVDGQVSLEDLNQELDLSLSGEGADRIAGWIMNQREQLPKIGDEVKAEGCRATVRRMRKHRIELVLLEKIDTEDRP